MSSLGKEIFDFLKELKDNNDREWFNEHKDRYKKTYDSFKAFTLALENEMSHHDELENRKVHRIYRDVRFSKDKTPYSPRYSVSFVRATKWRRGGYYLHIEPGKCFIGGGFWAPESADLKRIRLDIAADASYLRKIITDSQFVSTFGALQGEQLKTAPKGFDKNHPDIDLLRYKQFLIMHELKDSEVLAAGFAKKVSTVFEQMRPLFDYMSDVLTTDENGVPIE